MKTLTNHKRLTNTFLNKGVSRYFLVEFNFKKDEFSNGRGLNAFKTNGCYLSHEMVRNSLALGLGIDSENVFIKIPKELTRQEYKDFFDKKNNDFLTS